MQMSKICSKIFWMMEPCRNTNRMPFVSGFSLATKRAACSIQSRSFFLYAEQLDSHGFSNSFFASKEKGGLGVQSIPANSVLLEVEHQRNPQEYIWRSLWESLFPKTDMFNFSVHREPFWISAGWEIHHEVSVYILISHKVASQGQQRISAPAVPDGPSYAHKGGHFIFVLEETQERFSLITNSPDRTCIWSSFAHQSVVQTSLKRCCFAPCISVQHFTFPKQAWSHSFTIATCL